MSHTSSSSAPGVALVLQVDDAAAFEKRLTDLADIRNWVSHFNYSLAEAPDAGKDAHPRYHLDLDNVTAIYRVRLGTARKRGPGGCAGPAAPGPVPPRREEWRPPPPPPPPAEGR